MLEKTYTAQSVNDAVQVGLADLNVQEYQVKIEVESPGKKGLFGIGRQDAVVKLIVIDPELKRFESLESLKNRHKVSDHAASVDLSSSDITKEDNIQAAPSSKEEMIDEMDDVSESDQTLNEDIEEDKELKNKEENEAVSESQHDTQLKLQEYAAKTMNYMLNIIHEMGIEAQAEVTVKNSSDVYIEFHSPLAARIIGKRGQTLNALQLLAQNYYNSLIKSYTIVTLDIENYREKRRETLQNLALNMSKKALSEKKPVKFEPMPNYERKIMHQILSNIENIETYSEGREPHRYLVIKAR